MTIFIYICMKGFYVDFSAKSEIYSTLMDRYSTSDIIVSKNCDNKTLSEFLKDNKWTPALWCILVQFEFIDLLFVQGCN